MKVYSIAVGTTYKQKIGYLREILKELGIKAEIKPTNVKSRVSEQPITSQETKRGSINRAKKSFKNFPDVDFGVGIEVGYHKNNEGRYEMFCWSSVADKKNCISSQSHSFVLPKFHNKIISKKLYLSDHLDKYGAKKGSIEYIVDDIIRYRKPFITNSLRSVLLRYFSEIRM